MFNNMIQLKLDNLTMDVCGYIGSLSLTNPKLIHIVDQNINSLKTPP